MNGARDWWGASFLLTQNHHPRVPIKTYGKTDHVVFFGNEFFLVFFWFFFSLKKREKRREEKEGGDACLLLTTIYIHFYHL